MEFKENLFSNICNICYQYISEYDDYDYGKLCDSCYVILGSSWCDFCDYYGYKDYSEAVLVKGRRYIDNQFIKENWFKETLARSTD